MCYVWKLTLQCLTLLSAILINALQSMRIYTNIIHILFIYFSVLNMSSVAYKPYLEFVHKSHKKITYNNKNFSFSTIAIIVTCEIKEFKIPRSCSWSI